MNSKGQPLGCILFQGFTLVHINSLSGKARVQAEILLPWLTELRFEHQPTFCEHVCGLHVIVVETRIIIRCQLIIGRDTNNIQHNFTAVKCLSSKPPLLVPSLLKHVDLKCEYKKAGHRTPRQGNWELFSGGWGSHWLE